MPEFLLELRSEEIPSGMQERAVEQLATRLAVALSALQKDLTRDRIQTFVTPRRLAVAVEGLPKRQADEIVARKGPRIDAPDAARNGFLRSLGVDNYELSELSDKKGTFLQARFTRHGLQAIELLKEIVPQILAAFEWSKSMRWGAGDARWVRPLQSILCLFGGDVVPFCFAGIETGRITKGHRFMAPDDIEIGSFADYRHRLKEAFVVLDDRQRRQLIQEGAERLATERGLQLRDDRRLLGELKGLVEWPIPLLGRIDAEFMSLPQEVLVTSMREHQKFLAVEDNSGRLAPYFVVVANLEADDSGKSIVAGNERVLRARLWDAKFFWDQDRRIPLGDRLAQLEPMVFHEKLGSLRDKAERMAALARELAKSIEGGQEHDAASAGLLAKCDLVSGMVGEFPELQGIMGGYYARAEGQSPTIADAIKAHYRPVGPTDECPTQPLSICTALADKLDTLAGFFAIGIRPTGSGDPFALRRAALGVIRIILENRLRLSLLPLLQYAVRNYDNTLSQADPEKVSSELLEFLHHRLEVQQREAGTSYDVIRAAVSGGAELGADDLVRLLARVDSLANFLKTDDGHNLLVAYRRAANILRIESKKDNANHARDTAVDRGLLVDRSEVALIDAMDAVAPKIGGQMAKDEFADAMQTLSGLRSKVDGFFDSVMVNAEQSELRLNRLKILARLCADFDRIADFSLIED